MPSGSRNQNRHRPPASSGSGAMVSTASTAPVSSRRSADPGGDAGPLRALAAAWQRRAQHAAERAEEQLVRRAPGRACGRAPAPPALG